MFDIEFKFSLSKNYMKRIKSKSYYNHNYYNLDLHHYGDYIIPHKCNVLYQECSDDEYDCYYTLGYFEKNEFIPCFTWVDEFEEFDGVEEVE
jgi:hypothetical protein